jgi:ParB-like chromosome segregation protein Spo0J
LGRHRLEACRSLGWDKIAVVEPVDIWTVEDSCLDEHAVEMMEIAENLHRCELTTSQRNEHFARWVDLLEKRKPDIAAAASISKPGRKPSRAIAEVAKRSGMSRQAVKEAVKTAKLSPEVKAAADDAKLSHKQRLAIAGLPKAEQLSAVAKQAAIKVAADRAEARVVAKTPKPVCDVKPTADCAEAKPCVVAVDPAPKDSPDDGAPTLTGVLTWFERIRASIELEASIVEMSGSDLFLLDAQIVRVQTWIGQIAVIRAGVTGACGIVS